VKRTGHTSLYRVIQQRHKRDRRIKIRPSLRRRRGRSVVQITGVCACPNNFVKSECKRPLMTTSCDVLLFQVRAWGVVTSNFKSFKSDDRIKYYDFSAGEDSEVSARRVGSKLDCGDTVET
jgi:hypothetical protein